MPCVQEAAKGRRRKGAEELLNDTLRKKAGIWFRGKSTTDESVKEGRRREGKERKFKS